jgi:hypothetical protein
MWTKGRLFFSLNIAILNDVNTLVESSQTEASSAGEQLVRDSLVTDKKVNLKGAKF